MASPVSIGSPVSGLGQWLRRGTWLALDLILPPHCSGCGELGDRFCPACRASVRYILPPVCPHCGYPSENVRLCRACAGKESTLAGIRSVTFFEGPLQRALHSLKYKRNLGLAGALADDLVRGWKRWDMAADIILPVPLSRERHRWRGYNQAGLLARVLAERVGVPLAENSLWRTRDTASQIDLNATERRANVAGAFRAEAHPIAGRNVVVVDDVCTTGATLAECALALRAAGARAVWGFTLARAP